MQALTSNLLRIVLVSLALLIGLNTVGIDLTAFAVFSGAIGVGLGFGLQKIVSNFVSGIILLAEHSIKPGDVIEVGHTYGPVTSLGARYAPVRGRDGKEYLIPNETLITNQVINWSYPMPAWSGSTCRSPSPTAVICTRCAGSPSRRPRRPSGSWHRRRRSAISPISATARSICCCASGSTTRQTASRTSRARWASRCGNRSPEHRIELPVPQLDLHIRDLPPEILNMLRPREKQSDERRSAAD